MNRLSLFIVAILITIASPIFAAIYNIGSGDDFGNLGLVDYDEFYMTGGQGHNLNLLDWSTATIEDTDPLNIAETEGGIWDIDTSGYSKLSVSGGEFYELGGYDYSTINLSGGQILGNLTVYAPTAWVHIFGYGFNNDPFTGSPLTGFWADNTAFSINLVDSTISTYDQIVFHEIPEPASLLLIATGGLLLRRRS